MSWKLHDKIKKDMYVTLGLKAICKMKIVLHSMLTYFQQKYMLPPKNTPPTLMGYMDYFSPYYHLDVNK